MRCTDLGSGGADSGFGVSEVRWRWKGHVPEAQNFCQTSAPQAPKFFSIFCVAGAAGAGFFSVSLAPQAPDFFVDFLALCIVRIRKIQILIIIIFYFENHINHVLMYLIGVLMFS